MSHFGELLVRLDPWQVDYGTELPKFAANWCA